MTGERASKDTKPQQVQQPKPAFANENGQQELEVAQPTLDLTPDNILRLQRTIGNRELQRLMAAKQAGNPARTLERPPLRSVNPAPIRRKAEETEPQQEAEEEAPQVEAPAVMSASSGDAPPDQPPAGSPNGNPQAQVNHVGGTPGVQRGLMDTLGAGAEWVFEKGLAAAGVPVGLVMGFLKKAGGAFMGIIKDPAGFLGNLIGGVKQGFTQFAGNILTHLKSGMLSWLFGAMASAGIQLPNEFSMKSILSMVMQILGVTVDKLRERLVNFVGAKNVARVEKAWGVVNKFISEGVGGLWEMLKDYLSDMKTMVVDEIKNWVIVEIVKNAVIKVLSMFNPAGALAQIAMTIYNIVKFFIERASQIASLGEALMESVGAIAAGNVGALAQKIEQSLAKAIPVVLGFLMNLLGLSGVANKVREIVQKIQKKIQDAIDAVLKKIANGVKKLFGGGKEDKKAAANATADPEKQKKVGAGLAAIHSEEKQYLKEGAITKADAQTVASNIKKQYPVFETISIVAGGDKAKPKWVYDYVIQRTDKDKDKPSTTAADAVDQDRNKVLGTDPKRGYIAHEGEVGALIESRYGGFERDKTGDAEWVSVSGAYKGKTFDLLGVPPGKSVFHSDAMEKFLPSVDSHFRKSINYVVLDVRYMNPEQKKNVLEYVNNKYSGEKSRLILLE